MPLMKKKNQKKILAQWPFLLNKLAARVKENMECSKLVEKEN